MNNHEQRISELEEQNRQLRTVLDQQQKKQDGPGVTRRQTLAGILGGGALIGAAGTASASPDTNDDPFGDDFPFGEDGPPGLPFAEKDHDHSGDYLGEKKPVDRIDVTDLVSGQTPFFDVRAYGVVGDGETDDTAALQKAVEAATPNGVLYVPPELHVRITDVVDVDMGSKRDMDNFHYLGAGPIKPEAGASLEFHGGNSAQIWARVLGGSGSLDEPEIQADRLGMSEDWAIRLYDSDFTTVSVYGKDYPATLLQMDAGEQGDRFGSISTCSVGDLKSDTCGRSCYIGPGPFYGKKESEDDFSFYVFNYGLGQFRGIWEYQSKKNFRADFVNDLTIDYYENYEGPDTEEGLYFQLCFALIIDRMSIGGDATVPLVDFYECGDVNINYGYSPTSGGDQWVFDSTKDVTGRLIVGGAGGAGVRIDQTTAGDPDIQISSDIALDVTAKAAAGPGIVVTENVDRGEKAGWITIDGGEVRNCGGNGTPAIDVQSSEAVVALSTLRGFENPNADLRVVEGNDTHVLDCRLPEVEGEPATNRQL